MFATAERTIKTPGPDHPITITPNPLRVVVSVDGCIVADTREALTVREAHFGTVHYFPRKDVKMSLLERTSHATYCPYKGECNYYSIPAGGERSVRVMVVAGSPLSPNKTMWTFQSCSRRACHSGSTSSVQCACSVPSYLSP